MKKNLPVFIAVTGLVVFIITFTILKDHEWVRYFRFIGSVLLFGSLFAIQDKGSEK
ncbi:hypothetical protein [Bacillus sp. T33-2]|uniref:hypothetical protein n=1 Tax=Bacillus sp. T33-2 TaxID=2054168 RepID=UPI0015E10945|nr:hypothetical protein [Bacillus sp. T33-2]